MRAYVVHEAGGPDVLRLSDVPDPVPGPDEILVRVRAFGLNRSEVVTRRGGSGSAVAFPRILGIECVGEVAHAPGGQLRAGQKVAALMGGMGRGYDGSYAELTVVPATQVIPLDTSLTWPHLAAIPETYLTAWGCVHDALRLRPGTRLVVRPGASALGLAVAQLVNELGGQVAGITRSAGKAAQLKDHGFHEVVVTDGAAARHIRSIWSDGAAGVLDTVASARTVRDDLRIRARGGRICIAGSLSASSGSGGPGLATAATLALPFVTTYSSESVTAATHAQRLRDIVAKVENGTYLSIPAAVLRFDHLAEAHERMDQNRYVGKVVVTVP